MNTSYTPNFSKIDATVRLQRMVESGRVPHLLLFYGPKEAHKEEAARQFAAEMLGVAATRTHPDFHELFTEGKSGLHAASAVRLFLHKAAMRPLAAPRQFFIVHDAERMLPSSSNALLKTLEEPPSHSIFVLLTTHRERLLPTILSRCQKIAFGCATNKAPRELTAREKELIMWLEKGVSIEALMVFAKNMEEELAQREKGLIAASQAPHSDELPTKKGRGKKSSLQQESSSHLLKEIEGALALQAQDDFAKILEIIADWYRDLYLLRWSIAGPLRFPDHRTALEAALARALPYDKVESALQAARLAYQRTIPLQSCLEALVIALGLIKP